MRLFEIDSSYYPDFARTWLSVLQGQADKQGKSSEIQFDVIKNAMGNLGITTPDALIRLKDIIDPAGDTIARIENDGTVILNTKKPSDVKSTPIPTGNSKTVDQMASRAAKQP